MKILIIHDRAEVSAEILKLVVESGVRPEDVKLVEDGVGARSAMSAELFDFAIIDLTIPHIKGRGQANYTVVDDLLSEVFGQSHLNAPGDIVGLTKDTAALGAIDSNIGSHLMALIEEDKIGNWKKMILDRIEYAKKVSVSRQRSLNQNHVYDVAIITALDKELEPYRDVFEFKAIDHYPGANEFYFRDVSGDVRKGVLYSIGRAGQASAASASQAIITQFRPALIIMTGFCGGFERAKAKLGDIVFAELVYDWDAGKWEGDGEKSEFMARAAPLGIADTAAHRAIREFKRVGFKSHAEVLAGAMARSSNRIAELNILIEPIASGSSLVKSPHIISKISSLNDKIIGVDMEAFSFYYAASKSPVKRPDYFFVKAIADYCDVKKDDKEHTACCYLSAKAAEDIIKNHWKF